MFCSFAQVASSIPCGNRQVREHTYKLPVLGEKIIMIFNKAFLKRNSALTLASFLCKKALLNIMIIFSPRTGNLYVCGGIKVSRTSATSLSQKQ